MNCTEEQTNRGTEAPTNHRLSLLHPVLTFRLGPVGAAPLMRLRPADAGRSSLSLCYSRGWWSSTLGVRRMACNARYHPIPCSPRSDIEYNLALGIPWCLRVSHCNCNKVELTDRFAGQNDALTYNGSHAPTRTLPSPASPPPPPFPYAVHPGAAPAFSL